LLLIFNNSGDHIRVVRGATETNPHGTYDHHMLVIAVLDDVTLHVIHYTGEVANAAADSAVTSFSSFGSFGGGEDVDCESGEGARGGPGPAAVKEQRVKIQVRTEKVEVLEYPEQRDLSLFSPDEAIERARGRLGEKEYGVFKNNCECFVNWAVTGIATSNQYESGKWSALFGAAVGAMSGYRKEGFSGAAKGAVAGAQQSYQHYRENRP
jgi:hypothetical protein